MQIAGGTQINAPSIVRSGAELDAQTVVAWRKRQCERHIGRREGHLNPSNANSDGRLRQGRWGRVIIGQDADLGRVIHPHPAPSNNLPTRRLQTSQFFRRIQTSSA